MWLNSFVQEEGRIGNDCTFLDTFFYLVVLSSFLNEIEELLSESIKNGAKIYQNGLLKKRMGCCYSVEEGVTME